MAGQLKIGGNVIATHAGTEGAGTVTLDSSTLTIGSNTTVSGNLANATFPAGNVVGVGHSGPVTTITDFASSAKSLNNFTSFEYTLKTSNPYITIISNIQVFLQIATSTVGSGHFVVSMKNVTGGTTSHQEMEDFDANMHRKYANYSGIHQMHQTMTGTTRKQLSSVLDGSGITTAGTVIEIGIGVYRSGTVTNLKTNEGPTNCSGTNFLLLEEKS